LEVAEKVTVFGKARKVKKTEKDIPETLNQQTFQALNQKSNPKRVLPKTAYR